MTDAQATIESCDRHCPTSVRSIEQVNFQQGIIGRLLGYGQVDVHGTGMDNLLIPPIADPLRFAKAIEDAKGNSKPAAGLA